jgi:hypothetical protein
MSGSKTAAIASSIACLLLVGCSTERTSSPARTATEELLISTAADRAAEQLSLKIPQDKLLYIDSSNFSGTDSKYAISAIKAEILRRGGHLTLSQDNAEVIVEIALGALSIDQSTSIIGIPSFTIPVPTTGDLAVPEVALFKKEERRGIAKFSAFAYDARQGGLISSAAPDIGTSHKTQWVVALFISWNTNDITPEAHRKRQQDYFFGDPLPLENENWLAW